MIIQEEMNREQRLVILKKYTNPKDGVAYLPKGIKFNNWENIGMKFEGGDSLIDTVKEIEEEIRQEKFNRR